MVLSFREFTAEDAEVRRGENKDGYFPLRTSASSAVSFSKGSFPLIQTKANVFPVRQPPSRRSTS